MVQYDARLKLVGVSGWLQMCAQSPQRKEREDVRHAGERFRHDDHALCVVAKANLGLEDGHRVAAVLDLCLAGNTLLRLVVPLRKGAT